MRELRLLRQDPEYGNLIFKIDGSDEPLVLRVDDMVRAAVRFDVPHTVEKAPAPEPAPPVTPEPAIPISPRDIQMRVRAGETPETLAAEFGVSVDKVLRFAAAVVEERARIAGEARRARARRSGAAEGQTVVFGEAVDERYAAHGINPSSVAWDSRRREDGEWIILARWAGGEGEHSAEWVFHRASRSVTPSDDTAADLLSDRPIRPVRPPVETRPALSVAPPLMPGVVAFPPMPNADTGPLPVVEEVFDQEADLDEPRVVPPLVPQPVAAQAEPVAAEPEPAADFDAPPLPLGIAEPVLARVTNLGVTRREESEDDRAARARIPSWDDILLGVRRKD